MFLKPLTFVLFAIVAPGLLSAQNPASWIGKFPGEISESSGLLLSGDRFITHNDSGNLPVLYELDTASLQIVRRILVNGVQNRDWEALAEDEDHVYIGDFGNNTGNRRDLSILKIAKTDLSRGDSVAAETISFSYEDQTAFKASPRSDWDAEALVAGNDSLWVFTKQWQKRGTAVYRLPKSPGTYTAKRTGEYPVGGMVTAAVMAPGRDRLLLLAYTPQLQPILVQVPLPWIPDVAQEVLQKNLLSIGFAQSEGMAVTPDGQLFISSEAFSNRFVSLPAGVYRLDLETETTQEAPPVDESPQN